MKTSKFTQALAVVMNTKKVSDKSVSALQASLLRGKELTQPEPFKHTDPFTNLANYLNA